jgi:hypothetical protein
VGKRGYIGKCAQDCHLNCVAVAVTSFVKQKAAHQDQVFSSAVALQSLANRLAGYVKKTFIQKTFIHQQLLVVTEHFSLSTTKITGGQKRLEHKSANKIKRKFHPHLLTLNTDE